MIFLYFNILSSKSKKMSAKNQPQIGLSFSSSYTLLFVRQACVLKTKITSQTKRRRWTSDLKKSENWRENCNFLGQSTNKSLLNLIELDFSYKKSKFNFILKLLTLLLSQLIKFELLVWREVLKSVNKQQSKEIKLHNDDKVSF